MAPADHSPAPETASGPSGEFWNYLRAGRFMLQRSKSNGRYVFYPRTLMPASGETDLEWVSASGRGVVYAQTTIRRRPDRGGDFNISIVELDEGPRLTTRVLGTAPDEIAIGMKVVARIEPPSWRPASDGAQPILVFYPDR